MIFFISVFRIFGVFFCFLLKLFRMIDLVSSIFYCLDVTTHGDNWPRGNMYSVTACSPQCPLLALISNMAAAKCSINLLNISFDRQFFVFKTDIFFRLSVFSFYKITYLCYFAGNYVLVCVCVPEYVLCSNNLLPVYSCVHPRYIWWVVTIRIIFNESADETISKKYTLRYHGNCGDRILGK